MSLATVSILSQIQSATKPGVVDALLKKVAHDGIKRSAKYYRRCHWAALGRKSQLERAA